MTGSEWILYASPVILVWGILEDYFRDTIPLRKYNLETSKDNSELIIDDDSGPSLELIISK